MLATLRSMRPRAALADRIAGLLEQLNAAGVEVITKAEWDSGGIGRFARVHDPEGNPIELWEPPAAS